MRKVVFVLVSLLVMQCSADRTIDVLNANESSNLQKFQKFNTTHKLTIAEKSEPGEELILCLTFVDKATKEVLPNQKIQFYHANSEGEYEPTEPNDETTARLNGTVTTNKSGEVYIKTILPGDYGNSENNRHIHTTVYDAKPIAYDIFFEQYSGGMGNLMNSGNDQLFYANLKQTANGTLVCFLTIEVKNPKLK